MNARKAFAVIAIGALALTGCAGQPGANSDDDDAATGTAEQLIADGVMNEEAVLAEPATITIATAAPTAFTIPLYMAEAGYDSFKRRNLTVKIENMPGVDSYPLMATGQLDGNYSAPDVGMFNSINSGIDLAVVAPTQIQAEDAVDGLYCRVDEMGGKEFSWEMLKGKKIGSSQSNRGVSMIQIAENLEKAGVPVDEVEVVQMSTSDQVAALENGALFCGLIQEPITAVVEEAGHATFAARQMEIGFPNGSVAFGKSILRDNPEVGFAFVAALAELYQNELQGEWLRGNEAYFAELLDQPQDALEKMTTPTYALPLALPEGYAATFDRTWRNWDDLLQYEEPLEESQVIDDRFMTFANELLGL
ncbi:ABC transporter substrate-binding protein [Salinibacterium sp. GXW1014]|uniref:ABC transporter substrate-binding protein n=1 Tax=Salinibacterium sp. GXW1014 TaxID=3377838 RepID=UPI003839D4AC